MTPSRKIRYLKAMEIPVWVGRGYLGSRPASNVEPDKIASVETGIVNREIMTDCSKLDWQALTQSVARCESCELHKTRTKTVFGVGDTGADWLFVGEAPGADEDRQGEPFVGKAGQLLNAMLFALGLKREQVYIANVLKCRPPNNRDPQPGEVAQCEPYLTRQIELIKPKVILTLGRHAAHNLLKTDMSLGRLRGQRKNYQGVPVVVTYHPAYLLRNPVDKRKTWEDLCMAKDIVGDIAEGK